MGVSGENALAGDMDDLPSATAGHDLLPSSLWHFLLFLARMIRGTYLHPESPLCEVNHWAVSL